MNKWRLMIVVLVVAVSACADSAASPPGPSPECDELSPVETTDESLVPSEPDVRFSPGDAVADVVSNSPDDSVFVFSPGVYEGVSVTPKPGQSFLGERGAVLDGNGVGFAFRSASPEVTIAGLEITGYEPGSRDGVIHGDPGASGWTVAHNHIHHNAESAIDGVSEWRIESNQIHHHGRYGVNGSGAEVTVEGNEIFCNATELGATGDSGGTKFVHTTNLVLRGNSVHDNFGNGLWVDINNVDALIEDNQVVRNELSGIFLEISCGGVVRSNHLEGNGFGDEDEDWMSGAAIAIALTPDVEVYENTVAGNAMGIGGIQWDHGNVDAVTRCEPQLENLRVYDNVITQSAGAAAGLDAANFRESVWTDWGNQFFDNAYELSNDAAFRWGGRRVSLGQWQEAGQG